MPMTTMMQESVSVPTTRDQFFDALQESGVLQGDRLQRVSDAINPLLLDPKLIADELIEKGVITPFQSVRLLSGLTRGFVIGKYLLVDYLVKKDAARVYKARHRSMNRDVCLVLVNSEQTRKPEVRDYLDVEARRVAKLMHPNLITLYDVGSIGQRVYFVEEYMPGAELSVLLMQQGRLSVSRASHVLRQAALGLQHAHEKGMVHGRLKPTAIIVGSPKANEPTAAIAVKICGYGLSRLYDDSQKQGLEYLAPEQFAKPGLTSITADVYSLGCLYYTMLMGVPPFPCLSLYDAARFHSETAPPDIRSLRPDLPLPLANLMESMLAKDPAMRPQSMAEVSFALDTCPAHDFDSSAIDFSQLQRSDDGSQSMILSDTHTGLKSSASITPAPWIEAAKVDRAAFAISPATTGNVRRPSRQARTPADVSRLWFVLYGLMFVAILLGAVVLAKRFFG